MTAKQENIVTDDVDFSDVPIDREPFHRRRCSITVTLTDCHITIVDIQKMMEAGMNMVRFKMAAFTKDTLCHVFGLIDEAAHNICVKRGLRDWPVGKSLDLKTCIIRTGLLENTEKVYAPISENSEVLITNNKSYYDRCSSRLIYLDSQCLTTDVKVGTKIFIEEDELAFVCTEIIDTKTVKCIATKSGRLENMSIVNIRGMHPSPIFHNLDMQRILFAMENNVDVITVNFVRSVTTIRKLKQHIAKTAGYLPLILSGICTEQDLEVIDDIIKESDGVILSRQHLPYHIEESNLFRLNNIQKWIAAKCQQSGKPLYLSGGVFRKSLKDVCLCNAEILEVANAILDGVSGFVLRNCEDIDATLRCLRILNDLCCGIEPYYTSRTDFWKLTDQIQMPVNAAEAALMSCVALANQTNARLIILPTVTGRTVKAIHWMRPNCLVLAVCSSTKVTRKLYFYRSVVPLLCDAVSPEERIEFAVKYGVDIGWLLYGNIYVTLQRSTETSSFCDCVRVWTVTFSTKPLIECNEKGEEITPAHGKSVQNVQAKKDK